MALAKKTKFISICCVIAVVPLVAYCARASFFVMPGTSYDGPLLPMTPDQIGIRNNLSAHVEKLANQIGERSVAKKKNVDAAAKYIVDTLVHYGLKPSEMQYNVGNDTFENIEVLLPGTVPTAGVYIVGAHYDTAPDTPGANENASGVAFLLETARLLKGKSFAHPIRLVFFGTGSRPFFGTPDMGSFRYLSWCKSQNLKIAGMISVDEVGYYPDVVATQHYPVPLDSFYPKMGNYLTIVGTNGSTGFLKELVYDFRTNVKFPCEGVISPSPEEKGFATSDQYPFWKDNYPAVMLSDSKAYRYLQTEMPDDKTNFVDVDKICRIVDGFVGILETLASKNN